MGDEAVARAAERICENVERGRRAVRVDAVAALRLRREATRARPSTRASATTRSRCSSAHRASPTPRASTTIGSPGAKVAFAGQQLHQAHRLGDQEHRVRPEERRRDRPPALEPRLDLVRDLRGARHLLRQVAVRRAPARAPTPRSSRADAALPVTARASASDEVSSSHSPPP